MMPEWNQKRTLLFCRKADILAWGLHMKLGDLSGERYVLLEGKLEE